MGNKRLVLEFVESTCLLDKGLSTSLRDLWESFKEWSEEIEKLKLGRNTFYKTLSYYFIVDKRRVQGVFLKPLEEWNFFEKESINQVYLITDDKKVKIGISHNPEFRLNVLQIGSSEPLRLLGSFYGGKEEQEFLHNKYKEKNTGGEWFELIYEDVLWIIKYLNVEKI